MDFTDQARPSESVRLLIDAVQEISTARSLPEIMGIVKRTARLGAEAEGASFVLKEGENCYYADEDAISPLWQGRRFPMTRCVSGWSMLHRLAVVIPDITKDSRIPQDVYRPTFVRSLVMVPIRSREPLGAIGVYWAHCHQADDNLVSWLKALADATSAGLESVLAQQEVHALRHQMNGAASPNGDAPVRMCAWTRRLWHNGQWLSVEAFLHERYGLDVTHGMSEEALQTLKQGLQTLEQPQKQTLPAQA